MAGLSEIPAVILDGDDLKAAQVALIENIQREDLNPIEEAMAYKALIERFGLKQEEVAKQAGKSRSAVANMLRLLELPDEVLSLVQDEKLSMGHARAILGLIDEEKMLPLAEMAVDKELSVRDVEALVRKYNVVPEEIPETEESKAAMQRRIYVKELEDKARTRLGRKVKIHETNRKKTVELTYEDDEDLDDEIRVTVIATGFDKAPSTVGAVAEVVTPKVNPIGTSAVVLEPLKEEDVPQVEVEPEPDPFDDIFKIFNKGVALSEKDIFRIGFMCFFAPGTGKFTIAFIVFDETVNQKFGKFGSHSYFLPLHIGLLNIV